MNLKKIFFKHEFSIESFLDLLFLFADKVSIIQVGANDGQLCDPIRKYVLQNKVSGIMLEPQSTVFLRLKENYASTSGISFVNAALSDVVGETILYSVKDAAVLECADMSGVASFSKKHVEKELKSNLHHLIKSKTTNIQDLIFESVVPTVTYTKLLSEHEMASLDMLLIDAEGFDYQSIMLFPLDKLKPKSIIYEYKHMSSSEYKELEEYLVGMGYKPYYTKNDALFILC